MTSRRQREDPEPRDLDNVEFFGGPLDGAKIDFTTTPSSEYIVSCGCRLVRWGTEYGNTSACYPCGRDMQWHQTNVPAEEIDLATHMF